MAANGKVLRVHLEIEMIGALEAVDTQNYPETAKLMIIDAKLRAEKWLLS